MSQIDWSNSNALFLSTFGVKIDVKNERKRVFRMCENAYLSIKNPKGSRALNFWPQKLGPPWPNPGSAPASMCLELFYNKFFKLYICTSVFVSFETIQYSTLGSWIMSLFVQVCCPGIRFLFRSILFLSKYKLLFADTLSVINIIRVSMMIDN